MKKGEKLETLGNKNYKNRMYVTDIATNICARKSMQDRYNRIHARNGMVRVVTEVSTGMVALLNDNNIIIHIYDNEIEAHNSIKKLFS